MAVRAVLVLAFCGLICQAFARDMLALQTDRTLDTSGQTCLDKFEKVEKDNYADDANCATMIRKAMSGNTDQECPEGLGGSKSGSKVQKCMAKSEASIKAWSDFIKLCEVMNVNNRGGEAEAASDAKPSCFPRFSSLDEFYSYIKGDQAGKSTNAASAASFSLGAAALAAAGAVAALAL